MTSILSRAPSLSPVLTLIPCSHLADDGQTHDYIQQLAIMATNHRSSIYIDFGHVRDYHVALSDHIEAEYVKCVIIVPPDLENSVNRPLFVRD